MKSPSNYSPAEAALEEQIVGYFNERLSSKYAYSDFETEVAFKDSGTIVVTLRKMYHFEGDVVSFADLKFLSELLGTDEINVGNESYSPGCETCDHGSRAEIDLFISKAKIP